jgi:hypothetical protein
VLIFSAMREAEAATAADSSANSAKVPPATPQSPSARTANYRAIYLKAYLALTTASIYRKNGNVKEARAAFAQALADFQSIQTMDPLWEKALIMARIRDVQAALSELD